MIISSIPTITHTHSRGRLFYELKTLYLSHIHAQRDRLRSESETIWGFNNLAKEAVSNSLSLCVVVE